MYCLFPGRMLLYKGGKPTKQTNNIVTFICFCVGCWRKQIIIFRWYKCSVPSMAQKRKDSDSYGSSALPDMYKIFLCEVRKKKLVVTSIIAHSINLLLLELTWKLYGLLSAYVIRWKPDIYLWMTTSIIGCLGFKSVNYERLHSFLWDFHNWMKLWSFIHLWRTSSISGGRQQICQQNINVCQIWETFSGCSNVEFQSAQSFALTDILQLACSRGCPRCRYLGFSHNAIGPPHLTAFVSFWHFSYLENIHKE